MDGTDYYANDSENCSCGAEVVGQRDDDLKGAMMDTGRLAIMKLTIRELMEQKDLWAAHVDKVEKIGRISDVFKNSPNDSVQIRYDVDVANDVANTEDWKSEHVRLANVCVDIESARDRMDKLQSVAFDRVVKQVEDRHAEKFGRVDRET